jgi:alpha-D-xyloside xylohydrolase
MTGFREEQGALIWQKGHETLRIIGWGADGLRVQATMNDRLRDDLPQALLDGGRRPAAVRIGDGAATVTNGKLAAEIDAGYGRVRFGRSDGGGELLAETPPRFGQPPGRHYRPLAGGSHRIAVLFQARDDERFYGLGQRRNGRLNQKGCVLPLVQHNADVSIPFALSSRGYGFLWNNPAVGRVELAHNGTRWVADAAQQIDYYVTAGDSPAEIMQHYVDATGHAPVLPEFAAGFWQCKLRYRTQEELLEVARGYTQRGLPIAVIVIDFFHWTRMGEWRFDPACWPDPAAMVRELKQMGIEVMVSIWPAVSPHSASYAELRDRGLLLRTADGPDVVRAFMDTDSRRWGSVPMAYLDPTHPEARRLLWQRVRRSYYDVGIRLFWLDACEPEMDDPDFGRLHLHAGPAREIGCLYPLMHQRGFWEGLREAGEEEIITLCRSAWAGSQRYAAAVWSGDIESTFASLAEQVRAGLNMGLSGICWWTTDIGGFVMGDPASAYFRELIVRWFQYGVFCPLFRLHGCRVPSDGFSGGPNEVWAFGERAYGILREVMFLRERLRPYVMQQMHLASLTGTPPMRPLFFDFPDDPHSYEVEDEFLFGPDILVAPVTERGATQRAVYLPAGAEWTDAYGGERRRGGQRIVADAPLEHIPVYLRDGADLPIRG